MSCEDLKKNLEDLKIRIDKLMKIKEDSEIQFLIRYLVNVVDMNIIKGLFKKYDIDMRDNIHLLVSAYRVLKEGSGKKKSELEYEFHCLMKKVYTGDAYLVREHVIYDVSLQPRSDFFSDNVMKILNKDYAFDILNKFYGKTGGTGYFNVQSTEAIKTFVDIIALV